MTKSGIYILETKSPFDSSKSEYRICETEDIESFYRYPELFKSYFSGASKADDVWGAYVLAKEMANNNVDLERSIIVINQFQSYTYKELLDRGQDLA